MIGTKMVQISGEMRQLTPSNAEQLRRFALDR